MAYPLEVAEFEHTIYAGQDGALLVESLAEVLSGLTGGKVQAARWPESFPTIATRESNVPATVAAMLALASSPLMEDEEETSYHFQELLSMAAGEIAQSIEEFGRYTSTVILEREGSGYYLYNDGGTYTSVSGKDSTKQMQVSAAALLREQAGLEVDASRLVLSGVRVQLVRRHFHVHHTYHLALHPHEVPVSQDARKALELVPYAEAASKSTTLHANLKGYVRANYAQRAEHTTLTEYLGGAQPKRKAQRATRRPTSRSLAPRRWSPGGRREASRDAFV